MSSDDGGPAVVELFTSQGCHSCPAADEFLSEWGPAALARGEVIPLAYHVDYWDRIGWKDPFGSAAFTDRQHAYARAWNARQVYTPQMVVDGRTGFVGSDRGRAQEEAAKPRGSARSVAFTAALKGGRLELKVSAPAAAPEKVRVMLAVFENGLVTVIPRGENSGRTLRGDFVVRRLTELGKADAGKAWSETVGIDWGAGWKAENCGAAVFLQDEATLRIVGAAKVFPLKAAD